MVFLVDAVGGGRINACFGKYRASGPLGVCCFPSTLLGNPAEMAAVCGEEGRN